MILQRSINNISKGVLVVAALFLLSRCNDDSPGVEDNFDREALLTNMVQNHILPSYLDFAEKAEQLTASVETFDQDVSADNLESVRSAWLAARLSWKNAELFNFGPVDVLANERSIDLWPTNRFRIEEAVEDYDESDDYLVQIGSDRKGLPAMEYLLFDGDPLEALADQNRRAYLLLLAQDLEKQVALIQAEWTEAYQQTFVTSLGSDASSSITLLSNELVLMCEIIKNFKVATPVGIRTLGEALPEQVESFYAGQSKAFITQSLNAMEQVFTGGSGLGFDDYLNEVNARDLSGNALSETILAQIAIAHQTNNSIQGPLKDAVLNDEETVEQLFIDMQELTVLLKTDMMSQLGLIITFSDSDGD